MAEPRVTTVVKGDVLLWQDSVEMVVTRVAKDGSWADIRCHYLLSGGHWSKRQRLPMPAGTIRVGRTP